MNAEDLAFLRQHCLNYSLGDEGYADWYLHWYGDEELLDDVPDHSHVYPAYLAQTQATEARIGDAR